MLNLRKRELASVEFRRSLPEYLADGKPCYIRFSARAAGGVNPEYMAGLERNVASARVMDRRVSKIEDDEEHVKAQREANRESARQRLGLLYDACVISWETNILDGDAPMECTRETFLALAEVRGVPEIAAAIQAFEAECFDAGALAADDDKELVKN
nr:hypothetical protein [uncultured Roseovarius sp.]